MPSQHLEHMASTLSQSKSGRRGRRTIPYPVHNQSSRSFQMNYRLWLQAYLSKVKKEEHSAGTRKRKK
jgi:hypothetical protein